MISYRVRTSRRYLWSVFFSEGFFLGVFKEEDMVVVVWKIWDGIFVDLFVLRGGESAVIAKRIYGPASLGTPPPHPMVMGLHSSAPVPLPPCGVGGVGGVGGGGWWWWWKKLYMYVYECICMV